MVFGGQLMSNFLIHLIFIFGLAHILGCQVMKPHQSTNVPLELEKIRRGGIRTFDSLAEAPRNLKLYRNKQTGKIYDISGLPSLYQSRYSKNPQLFEEILIRD